MGNVQINISINSETLRRIDDWRLKHRGVKHHDYKSRSELIEYSLSELTKYHLGIYMREIYMREGAKLPKNDTQISIPIDSGILREADIWRLHKRGGYDEYEDFKSRSELIVAAVLACILKEYRHIYWEEAHLDLFELRDEEFEEIEKRNPLMFEEIGRRYPHMINP